VGALKKDKGQWPPARCSKDWRRRTLQHTDQSCLRSKYHTPNRTSYGTSLEVVQESDPTDASRPFLEVFRYLRAIFVSKAVFCRTTLCAVILFWCVAWNMFIAPITNALHSHQAHFSIGARHFMPRNVNCYPIKHSRVNGRSGRCAF